LTRRPPRPQASASLHTRVITGGRGEGLPFVNPPVTRASTILFPNLAALDAAIAAPDAGLYYGRRGTPTHWALEDALASLEPEAQGCKLYPSGVAAITTALLSVLNTGDELLITDNAYEPSRQFADQFLARMGITTRYLDPHIGQGTDLAPHIGPKTRAILLESPGSLSFEVQDLPKIAATARAHGIITLIDNTWATPLRLQPLALGIDIAIQSLTKYVAGHSDVMMGAVTTTPALWPMLCRTHYRLGHSVSADDAALTLRGLRTLAVRLDRHEQSALHIAQWLETHPAVAEVLHPGLPSHPDHALFTRDFTGSTGLFAVALTPGSRADIARLVDGFHHFGLGFSWGGYESLALPVDFHGNRTATTPRFPGPLLRLSIGLEDPADLIADLDAGLARYLSR
jgi:cystathionine beta-lyase